MPVNHYCLLVALFGAVVHGATNGKFSELGRLAFAIGLLAFMLAITR